MAEMIPVDASSPSCSVDRISSPLSGEDFVFVGNSHPNKLLEGLNRLRLNNVFCDVTLCCGGQEFPGHRNVLASFSSYFELMFTTDLMESKQESVSIIGVEPEMMGLLFNYAYTSEVVISTSNVQALLAASHLLNVTAVQEACCQYMERHMDEKNCVAILGLAETYYCQMLEKSSMAYILEHFGVVYQQVLEKIRLPLISPSYLHDVIECLDVVKESQGCQRLISEAKNQDVLPRWSAVPEVIVMVGGEDYGRAEFLRCGESFDPLTKEWRTLGHLPFAVRRHGLVVSDCNLYLAGGELKGCSISRQMWQYDRSGNTWSEMAPMNEARYDLGLVVLDGYVYAVGGCGEDGRSCRNSVERYDPSTNTWQLMESVGMSDVSMSPGMVALEGLIYALVDAVEKEVYTYNPNTSVWTEVAPRLIGRSGSAVCSLKGKIYVIGGQQHPHIESEFEDRTEIDPFDCLDDDESFCNVPFYDADTDSMVSAYTDRVECYNPQTNKWTLCAPMNRQRSWPGVTVLHGKIYVLGGEDTCTPMSSDVDTIERYCEATNRWELVGEMPRKRRSLRCVSTRLRAVAHTANTSVTQDGASYRPTRPMGKIQGRPTRPTARVRGGPTRPTAPIRGGCQNCGPKW